MRRKNGYTETENPTSGWPIVERWDWVDHRFRVE